MGIQIDYQLANIATLPSLPLHKSQNTRIGLWSIGWQQYGWTKSKASGGTIHTQHARFLWLATDGHEFDPWMDDSASTCDESNVGETPNDNDYHAPLLNVAMGKLHRTKILVPQDNVDDSTWVNIVLVQVEYVIAFALDCIWFGIL